MKRPAGSLVDLLRSIKPSERNKPKKEKKIMTQPRSIFGPLFLIAAGAIWLLTQSGKIRTTNLWALTHIWPYVLIAAGVGLVMRSYWRYTNILFDLIIIGGAVLAILYAPKVGWDNLTMFSMIGDRDFYIGPSKPASGAVVTETRDVAGFNSIRVSYPAQVFVTQGNSVSVKIEAQEDVLRGLHTRIRNNKLEIFYKVEDGDHLNATKPVKINIVVTDLRGVDFESTGDLSIDSLTTDKLNLAISGAGNLKLKDISAKSLFVTLSGAGSMTASGATDDLSLVISGFGSFNGKDLHTSTTDVNLNGAGSATVWATDQLDAMISGAGSVNYYGSPQVSKQVSGVGSVSKSGDK